MRALSLIPLFLTVVLAGCSNSAGVSDLQQFMDETKNRPRGRIEPPPVFKPYEHFSYSAAGLRAPFELPMIDPNEAAALQVSNVRPDDKRIKGELEKYPLGSLSMVGTMKGQDGRLWALVKDGDGHVRRVLEGHYMGQNHGRIVSVSEYRINLIEIAPNGVGGWIERPRTLALDGMGGE